MREELGLLPIFHFWLSQTLITPDPFGVPPVFCGCVGLNLLVVPAPSLQPRIRHVAFNELRDFKNNLSPSCHSPRNAVRSETTTPVAKPARPRERP